MLHYCFQFYLRPLFIFHKYFVFQYYKSKYIALVNMITGAEALKRQSFAGDGS